MNVCGRCDQSLSRCLCVHSSKRQFKHRYLLRCAFCGEQGHDVKMCVQAPRRLRFDIIAGEYVSDLRSRRR
jgi:hypothetical protein